eukprot:IDg538t1
MTSSACFGGLVCLANNPFIVFAAYIAAFFPLVVIYSLDFTSPKMKSVRKTRRDGIVFLLSSILPLAYVLFYMYLQNLDKDYKEMAAATTAAVFCLVHIIRTIWGLVQVHVFQEWCTDALCCLMRMGYEAPVYEYYCYNSTESEKSDTKSFSDVRAIEASVENSNSTGSISAAFLSFKRLVMQYCKDSSGKRKKMERNDF